MFGSFPPERESDRSMIDLDDLTLEEINWLIAGRPGDEDTEEGVMEEAVDENFQLRPGENSEGLSENTDGDNDDDQPKESHKYILLILSLNICFVFSIIYI